jgi:hypothetical protein
VPFHHHEHGDGSRQVDEHDAPCLRRRNGGHA